MSLHATIARDLTHMLEDANAFALEARIAGRCIRGIYDGEYAEVQDTEGYVPVFHVAEASLAGELATLTRHGAVIVIDHHQPRGSVRYTVVGVQPDGQGQVMLRLEEA